MTTMREKLGAIGDYIQETMDSWQIPGTAVAVIHGDDVLHMAGYGLRNVEAKLPVTPDTRFALASMTKAFTAMGVALQVDDGKLEWDKPVREYMPSFKIKDSYVSDNITLRDMLSHRSGLPRHDLAWFRTDFTREELIHNVRYHELNKTFRQGWEYQNFMYIVAGYVTGLVSGKTWEEFIQERIFDCLGMSASTFYATEIQKTDDFSYPYRIRRQKGKPDERYKMPFYDNPTMGPAGSIHSNLNDLVKWLLVHLNDGKSGDSQFVSSGNLAQMHRPQMIMPVSGMNEKLLGTTIAAYGMGWFIEPYRGYTIVEHGGNIDGFSLNISFIPQEKLGVVALTNLDGRPLRDYLRYEIYDRLLGLPDHEWNRKYHAIWDEMFKGQDQGRDTTATEKRPSTTPSHPLSAYVGEYAADGYADFRVKQEGEALFGWLGAEWYSLEHYHYDIFELHMTRFDIDLKVTFQTDTRGEISGLLLPLESAVKDIQFTRKPLSIGADVLDGLVGVYDLPFDGMVLAVAHKTAGKLFAQVTGQNEIELVPYQSAKDSVEFTAKDQPNVTVTFAHEASGWVVMLNQAGTVFRAPRIS